MSSCLLSLKKFDDEFQGLFSFKNVYENLEFNEENKFLIDSHEKPVLFLISAKNAIENGGTESFRYYTKFYYDWYLYFKKHNWPIFTYADCLDNQKRVIEKISDYFGIQERPKQVKFKYDFQPKSITMVNKIRVKDSPKRIIIIGNGPSFNKKALKKIRKDDITIGCNYVFKQFVPDFLCISDKEPLFSDDFPLDLNSQYIVSENVYHINPDAFKKDTQSVYMFNISFDEYVKQNLYWPACIRTNNTVTNICVPLAIQIGRMFGNLPIHFIGVEADPRLGHFYKSDIKPIISSDMIDVIRVYNHYYSNMYNSSYISRLKGNLRFKRLG